MSPHIGTGMAVLSAVKRLGPAGPAAALTVREPDGAVIDGVTDAECVARVRAGDSAAFEPLVRRHARAAFAVAFACLGDADEAEDISQDAFVRAYERLAQCREPERFGAWLLRIVRNQSFKRRAWLTVRRMAGPKLAAERAGVATPEDALERKELRRDLVHALDGLRTVQRSIILMYDLEGFSHREIAERMGISEMMSRRHLSDARAKLRRTLSQRNGGG